MYMSQKRRPVKQKLSRRAVLCMQASFLTKKLNIAGRRATLSIWDTAGQERFHALGPIYYRDSNGAILVYDITDEDSFQKVESVAGRNLHECIVLFILLIRKWLAC